MSQIKKKSGHEQPTNRMQTVFAAGDVGEARRLAWGILQSTDSTPEEQVAAERLRALTEIDRRALGIALVSLALAGAVIVLFLLG